MTNGPFISYAQNGEDVVLHRALRSIERGRYIDVGANDPTIDSVTRWFYEAGWRGITVEPVHEYADRQRSERPEDFLVEAAVTERSGERVTLLDVPGTGLSTLDEAIGRQHRSAGYPVRAITAATIRLDDALRHAGWSASDDIHFMCVDVEGGEAAVLASIDLAQWRPWIIVAEATRPQTDEPSYEQWEPALVGAGYRFAMFDGLSRFYVADERWAELHRSLAAPANPLDDFVPYRMLQLQDELAELHRLLAAERSVAAELRAEQADLNDRVTRAELAHAAGAQRSADFASRERQAIRSALAWRTRAVEAWAARAADSAVSVDADELAFLRRQTHMLTTEMTAIRQTVSWRLTKPLRVVRLLGRRGST